MVPYTKCKKPREVMDNKLVSEVIDSIERVGQQCILSGNPGLIPRSRH